MRQNLRKMDPSDESLANLSVPAAVASPYGTTIDTLNQRIGNAHIEYNSTCSVSGAEFMSRYFQLLDSLPDHFCRVVGNRYVEPLIKHFLAALMPIQKDHMLSRSESSDAFDIHATIDYTFCDYIRTKRFSLAVVESVNELANIFEGDLHVVDAGCGPFALFGLIAACTNPRVSVTCIEIDPLSATVAQSFIEQLGLNDRVTIINGDATHLVLDRKAHLIISETMNSALQDEPLCAIIRNLQKYLVSGGLVIPEKIHLDLSFGVFSEDSIDPIVSTVEGSLFPVQRQTVDLRAEIPEEVVFKIELTTEHFDKLIRCYPEYFPPRAISGFMDTTVEIFNVASGNLYSLINKESVLSDIVKVRFPPSAAENLKPGQDITISMKPGVEYLSPYSKVMNVKITFAQE